MIKIRELMNDYEKRWIEDRLSLSDNHIYGVFYNTKKEKRFVQEYGGSILDLFITKNTPFTHYFEFYDWFNHNPGPKVSQVELYTYPLLSCNEREFMVIFQDYLNKLFENENKDKNDFEEIVL